MVCVLVFVRTSDWTVPIAVIQTGDQIAIDLLNKTFCVHLLCTKGLVFFCYSNCFLNIKTRRKGEVYERNLSADKRGII
jgi:hypothetical protein